MLLHAEKIEKEHPICFPHLGSIKIHSIKVLNYFSVWVSPIDYISSVSYSYRDFYLTGNAPRVLLSPF